MKIIKSISIEHLDAIIDTLFDPLWICDGEARVVFINKIAERLHNIKLEDLINKKINEEFIRNGIWDVSLTLEALKKKASVTMVQEFKNGRLVLAAAHPIVDKKGNIDFVITISRDITELNYLIGELGQNCSPNKTIVSDLCSINTQESQNTGLIARSKSMQSAIELSMRAAQADCTVLIEGESGVGKSFFANFMHNQSKRCKEKFLRVDCSAIPEFLIESELFGYEKGAFTGASDKGKSGLFEIADNGTLFLDEIGDISLQTQLKLLRFLEEKEFFHIGGTSVKNLNVRIIAATNKNIKILIKKSKFREDLFYRLNVISITIPPLRKRVDDIPALAYHYLRIFCKKYDTKKFFRPIVLDCLCSYNFPGNIRELINIIERMVVLSPTDCIDFDTLPKKVTDSMDIRQLKNNRTLSSAVNNFEKKIIVDALNTYKSQTKAAKALGIDQSTLSRKCKHLKISYQHSLLSKTN